MKKKTYCAHTEHTVCELGVLKPSHRVRFRAVLYLDSKKAALVAGNSAKLMTKLQVSRLISVCL